MQNSERKKIIKTVINPKTLLCLILPQYKARAAHTLSCKRALSDAVGWSLDTLLACWSPSLAQDSTGASWRYRTDPTCIRWCKSSLRGTLGAWMGFGTWCIVQAYPFIVAQWQVTTWLGTKDLLGRLPWIIPVSNAGCKDTWTLQCTGDTATEISGISDNSKRSEETRSDFCGFVTQIRSRGF